jgi:hypothetical protein
VSNYAYIYILYPPIDVFHSFVTRSRVANDERSSDGHHDSFHASRVMKFSGSYDIDLFNSFVARLRSANVRLFVEQSSEDHD